MADAVRLDECPPGLFMFDGTLCFRSEYTTTLDNPRRYQPDAYVVETGEYFWGGAKTTEERSALMVVPVSGLTPADLAAERAEAARLREDLNDVGRICAAIIGENERLLRAIGLNADYARVPRDLVCKHAAALAGEAGQ